MEKMFDTSFFEIRLENLTKRVHDTRLRLLSDLDTIYDLTKAAQEQLRMLDQMEREAFDLHKMAQECHTAKSKMCDCEVRPPC